MRWGRMPVSRPWHRWFAWRPVFIDIYEGWVWLQFIERQISFGNRYYRLPVGTDA